MFSFCIEGASFEYDKCKLIFIEKQSTFYFCFYLWRVFKTRMKMEIVFRYVVCFHFCTKRRTFVFQFNRIVHFNGENCIKEMVHSTLRLPRSKILKCAAYWLKNFIFKRRCVTEEWARVPTAEVSFCVHSVNTIYVCWCSYWSFSLSFFQVPLISCASTWRAGETKNDATPNLKTLLQLFAIFLDNSYLPISFFVFVCLSFYFHCADFWQIW
jgi:hypothetical protein